MRKQYDDQIAKMTPAEIAKDPGLNEYAQASAKVLFGDYCAACHGSGGAGNVGFPVLTDDDWLYGGSVAKIQETITGGRQGAMTAHEKILTADEVDQLAKFVVALHDGGAAAGGEAGWALYKAKGCTACHGEKADGHLVDLPNGEFVTRRCRQPDRQGLALRAAAVKLSTAPSRPSCMASTRPINRSPAMP